MHLLLLLVFAGSMASTAAAVAVLFIAVWRAKREGDTPVNQPASAVGRFLRHREIHPAQDTVPSIQIQRRADWDEK